MKDSPCELAAYGLVHETRHRAQLLADVTSDPQQVILNRVALNNESHHTRLRDAVVWQKATDDHRILFAMCDDLGYARPPRLPGCVSAGTVAVQAMHAMKEFGEFIAACEAAARDGNVTARERNEIRKQWLEMEATVSSLVGLTDQPTTVARGVKS